MQNASPNGPPYNNGPQPQQDVPVNTTPDAYGTNTTNPYGQQPNGQPYVDPQPSSAPQTGNYYVTDHAGENGQQTAGANNGDTQYQQYASANQGYQNGFAGNASYPSQPYQYNTYPPQQTVQPQEEKASVGFAILSYLVPIAGLIIYCTMKDSRPKTAKVSGKCALASFIINLVLSILIYVGMFALVGSAVNTATDYSDDYSAYSYEEYDQFEEDDLSWDYNNLERSELPH